MKVAKAWNKTVACQECGSWDAVWTSRFAGDSVEHIGDVSVWCKKCSVVGDVMLSDVDEVRVSPDGRNWRERGVWYHYGSASWWEDCPDDVLVHVGMLETSMWLYRIRKEAGEEYEGGKLYCVAVDEKPDSFIRDKGDGWGSESVAYLNEYEQPGSVSLYLPKSKLRIVGVRDVDE